MISEVIFLCTCDFCEGPNPAVVKFARVYDQWDVSHWLEPIHPLSGSDHLAVWCQSCGPKHRSDDRYREWMISAMERTNA